MNRSRLALGTVAVLAFTGGVLFASNLDWTARLGAQGRAPGASARATPTPGGPGVGFADVAESVTPAVVSVQAEQAARRPDPRRRQGPPNSLEEFFQLDPRQQQAPRESSGSGFIVTKDGYILTNNHVIEGADRVEVKMTDSRVFKAQVVGRDPTTDVAVIKIDGGDLPTVPFGDDTRLRIGDWVLAVGNPLGLDFTVTAGIVSAKGRGGNDLPGLNQSLYAISDFIQTDAAINPGNSGGPLVNNRGEVVGINSAIASRTGFYSGYGFAIPITLARQVMDDLIAHGRVRRAVLGISINEVTPEDAAVAGLKSIAGVKVGGFSGEDSPARKAGIEPGDIIIKADDKPVDRVSTLQRIVRGHSPGETIPVEVARYGQRKTLKVKLVEAPRETAVADAGARPDDGSPAVATDKLGITVEPLTAEFVRANRIPEANRGVLVADVDPVGPARGRLAPRSDIIVEVLFPEPKKRVTSTAELQAALASLKDGGYVSLLVYNPQAQGTRVVNLRIGER